MFYTNVRTWGNKLLVRGVDDTGSRYMKKVAYSPSLFVPSKKSKTKHQSVFGDKLDPVQFETMKEAKEFVEKYKDVSGFQIWGMDQFHYAYIADTYPTVPEYEFTKLRVVSLDLESECENGFPDYNNPTEKINALSLKTSKKVYLFGIGDFDNPRDDIDYFDCANEKHLLEHFLAVWERLAPDIITGWNIEKFDLPYLWRRMNVVLGEDQAKRLSPWKQVREDMRTVMGKSQLFLDVYGISQLDYLSLYRKFTYVQRENYKLDYIAFVELGRNKVDYSEYDGFKDFYTRNYQKFLIYNVEDNELVFQLEAKLKLIELAVAMAYDARVNFEDVFSPIRSWDVMIFNYLRGKDLVIPFRKQGDKEGKYEGAYVKDPPAGLYDWLVSFDLNSLYPSIIRQWNISPDTHLKSEKQNVQISRLIAGDADLTPLKTSGVVMAANGSVFTKGRTGFISDMLKDIYDKRTKNKKLMIAAKRELEAVKKELEKRGVK